MVSELVDVLFHRSKDNSKEHPFMRGLSIEARSGYRKACGDIAVELQHAINHDEQSKLIGLEDIIKLKKEVNKLIRAEGKMGRPSIYGEDDATEIL